MPTNAKRSPFLDSVRAAIRVRHYSYATEKTYVDWVRRFIFYHNKRHPTEMAEQEGKNIGVGPSYTIEIT